MYPAGFRIYRTSRGIKQPEVSYMDIIEAEDKVYDLPVQYESTFEVIGQTALGDPFYNVINTRQYNRKRWKQVKDSDDCPFL